MARPREPLISRSQVVDVVLSLLKTEGIDAVTLRRIASELNVTAASLYHHFEGKDDILRAAARASISHVAIPARETFDDEHDWLVKCVVAYYDSFVANPHVIPLLVSGYLPRDVASNYTDVFWEVAAGQRSRDEALLAREAIEGFTVGAALMAHIVSTGHSVVTARKARDRTTARRQRFEHVVQLLVHALLQDRDGTTLRRVQTHRDAV